MEQWRQELKTEQENSCGTLKTKCVGCGIELRYNTQWEVDHYGVCWDCIPNEPQPDSIRFCEQPEL